MKDRIISWVVWVFVWWVVVFGYSYFTQEEQVVPGWRTQAWVERTQWGEQTQTVWENTRVPGERNQWAWATWSWEVVRERPANAPTSNSWTTWSWRIVEEEITID
jgi:hypothetical protein